ncbi:MAG TPA: cytochrome bc complex cytochrome b subunit, partial [Actinomycetales bacterium]|nr:cytochrome bc complex cytochrome b subunit [Actinomycetales bacterium]
MTTKKPLQASGQHKTAAGKTGDWLDQRTGAAKAIKEFARKVFPDHWSFLLGEVALYSFLVLVLTGVFLALYFDPSMTHVVYPEDAMPVSMQGVGMSAAYASTLNISFHVTGGLLMRQIHHWAALLFMAAIVTHMFRVFFTGAFRKPREVNWVIGFTLMILGLLAGFTGYSLPDDVLSGNGLRIADGVARSIPIIGSYASLILFGGEFPGTDLIPRLFAAHILLVPGLILALVGLHLMFVVLHKHTQFPGPGRTQRNVVGYPLFPVYTAKAGGFFFIVFGVLALMGALLSINAVWAYGPYDPSPVSAGAQPDWYMLFLEGGLRLMPGWESEILRFTISWNILVPGVVIPGALFTLLAVWPFLERAASKDNREHHLLDRPRNAPVRTGVGVALITAFAVLVAAGANDLMATHLHLDMFVITWVLRFGFFVFPVLAFLLTK